MKRANLSSVPSAVEEEGDILLPTFAINFLGFRELVLSAPPINPEGDNELPEDTTPIESKEDEIYEPRYCTACNLEQPIRAKHCHTCNRCVNMYDHHCPWTGN